MNREAVRFVARRVCTHALAVQREMVRALALRVQTGLERHSVRQCARPAESSISGARRCGLVAGGTLLCAFAFEACALRAQSTARDVSRLVSHTMTSPILRKIVNARHHSVRVHAKRRSSGGSLSGRAYPYNNRWVNTNQLLGYVVCADSGPHAPACPPALSSSATNAVPLAAADHPRYIIEGVKTVGTCSPVVLQNWPAL
jgi:hypothetical protein